MAKTVKLSTRDLSLIETALRLREEACIDNKDSLNERKWRLLIKRIKKASK